MRRLLGLILFASLVLPALAQNKQQHPFTFEDMMALKRVGEPIISPDGKWVLFSAIDASLEANTKTPHVWVVPTAGGEPREIILVQESDRPRWAPDGKRFLFLSSKEGGSQIWIADFDATKGTVTATHKLTSIATEADGPLWSPDGKNILFVSNVYPECPDEACNAKKVEEAEQSKVKALIFTRLLYRHWNAYKAGKRNHLLIVPAEGGASRDLTPGDHDVPPFSLGGQDDYAFSPDGQEICYTSNHEVDEALSTNNDLFIVSVNGGAAKKITDNPASDSSPLYSPDGKYIAYRAQVRPGYESDRFRLMLYDRKTGEKRSLSEEFDSWVGTFIWTPDSSGFYLVAGDKSEAPIYFSPLNGHPMRISEHAHARVHQMPGSTVEPMPEGWNQAWNDDLAITADGKTLLFTRMTLDRPNEILRWTIVAPNARNETIAAPPVPLTHLNESVLNNIEMSPLES